MNLITLSAKNSRKVSFFLLFVFISGFISPDLVLALSEGPAQPELTKFSPVGSSDNVDLFTGDFKYNIPLFSIGGYPINLNYSGNVGMEDEASWVGLGWSLNPGAIQRNLRGLPDDFKTGDEIKKQTKTKPNVTISSALKFKPEKERMGWKLDRNKLTKVISNNVQVKDLSVNVSFNNYKGLSVNYGIGLGAEKLQCLDFGLSSGNNSGLSLTPSLSLAFGDQKDNNRSENDNSWELGAACSFNSETGLQDLTLNAGYNYECRKTDINSSSGASLSFARQLYTPSIPIETKFQSYSATLKLGKQRTAKIKGIRTIPVTYTKQTVNSDERKFSPIGYMYMDETNYGNENKEIRDVSNEGGQGLSKHTKVIGYPVYSYDVFSINANGIGGQFKAERGNLGIITESSFVNGDDNNGKFTVSPGIEFGFAADAFQVGADIKVNYFKESGGFDLNVFGFNSPHPSLVEKYKLRSNDPTNKKFEGVYFKMIGEGGMKWLPKNSTYPNAYVNKYAGISNPEIKVDKFNLTQQQRYLDFGLQSDANPVEPFDGEREIRSTVIRCLTAKEASEYGLVKVIRYFPVGNSFDIFNPTAGFTSISRINSDRKEHHISEINVTDGSGNRFVFGIPVYNLTKTEVQFSVAAKPGLSNSNEIDFLTGLVDFKKADIEANDHGIDRYTNKETTSAYATSYLLTAWLAPDYQDIGNNGPTDDDMGNFVKFNYSKSLVPYQWRTPYMDRDRFQAIQDETDPDNKVYAAAINTGSISNDDDDRATYVTGSRETYFVHSIESKEEIAIFYINDNSHERKDAFSVDYGDNNYGETVIDFNVSRYLDKIEIYNKNEIANARSVKRTPIPLKTVHFEYSYELCSGVYNNKNYLLWTSGTHVDEGKLTLKKVWFTFGTSDKGENVPYQFEYAVDKDGNPVSDYNPSYHPKGYDMWGNYKPQAASLVSIAKLTLDNSQYPFVDHNVDKATQKSNNDKYSNAWCLHRIKLPSGATMYIDYESDTYGYVQDKKVMNMMKIVGFGRDEGYDGNIDLTDDEIIAKSSMLYENAHKPNNILIFEMQDGYSVHDYIPDDMKEIFISCLLKLKQSHNTSAEESDYISGFYKLKLNGLSKPIVDQEEYDNKHYGCVLLEWQEPPALGDSKGEYEQRNDRGKKLHPIALRGLDYLLQNRQDIAYFGSNLMQDNDGDGGEALQYVTAFLNVFPKLYNLIVGHYTAMVQRDLCKEIVKENSWIRVQNPATCKYGGGNRVKRISIKDYMEGEKEYGVEYDYSMFDPNANEYKTSGVAAYEPVIGRSENPLFVPLKDEWHVKQALSRKHQYLYHHGPDLEALYPAPIVGYSQVTMRTLYNEDINRHGTGRTVYQYYTAKDYPVHSEHSDMSPERSWWPIPKVEKISAAQSFFISLNDMHGKMKSKFEYQYKFNQSLTANSDMPFAPSSEEEKNYIAGEEYKYYEDVYHNLVDEVPYLDRKENEIKTGIFGREVEYYMNFRAENTFTLDCSVELNLIIPKTTVTPPIPVFSPVVPIPNSSATDMRTYAITKVVRQYGILKEIIVHKDGSSLMTKNIGFDPQTGGVLLSGTQTEYGNYNYNLSVPANWMEDYKGMGPAYTNTGIILPIAVSSGITDDHTDFMAIGDELVETSTYKRYWVMDIKSGYASLIDEMGNAPADGNLNLKVIRSGYKNILSAPVANFTHSADNHVDIGENFHSEKFEVGTSDCKMLNASINEYTQKRKKEYTPIESCQVYFSGKVMDLVNADIAYIISQVMKDQLEAYNFFTPDMKYLRNNLPGNFAPSTLGHGAPGGNYSKIDLFKDDHAQKYLSALLVEYFKAKAKSLSKNMDKLELHFDYSQDYSIGLGNWFEIESQMFDDDDYPSLSTDEEKISEQIVGIDFIFRVTFIETGQTDCHYRLPFRDLDTQQERIYRVLGPGYFADNLFVDISSGSNYPTCPNLARPFNLRPTISYITTTSPYTYTYTIDNNSTHCGYLNYGSYPAYILLNHSDYLDLFDNFMTHPNPVNAVFKNLKITDGTNTLTLNSSSDEYTAFGTFHDNLKDAEFSSTFANPVFHASSYTFTRSIPIIKVNFNNETTIFPLIDEECLDICDACSDYEFASGDKINPFLNNILGQWIPSKQYSFFGSRKYLPPGGGTDYNQSYIKNEGYFESNDFSSLIKDTLNTWIFERNTAKRKKWNYPENVTITDEKGRSIEGANLLKMHSSLEMSKAYNDLVYAKVSNAKKEQIINVNFEDYGNYLFRSKSLCSFIDKLPFDDLFGEKASISNTESHSGRYSVRIESNAGGTGAISCMNISALSDQSRTDEYNTTPPIRTMYKIKNQDFYNTFSPRANERYVLSYWVKATEPQNFEIELQTNGSCSSFTSNISLVAVHPDIEVDGWVKREFTFQVGSSDPGQIQFYFNNQSTYPAFVDDVRILPVKGNMVSYVYDLVSGKLSAQLDENNFARFYEYDAEGNLIRTKVETERGIMTINENRQHIKGNN